VGTDAPDELVFSPAQRMQGERNPDSVLFRLEELETPDPLGHPGEPNEQPRSPLVLLERDARGDGSSAESTSAGSTAAGSMNAAASGIIDLRRMIARPPAPPRARERAGLEGDVGIPGAGSSVSRGALFLGGLMLVLVSWVVWSVLG